MTSRIHDNLDDLRHIEGFPIGEDEDLHALSDPPHYTAYPNPHIAEFIERWGKPYDEETDDYHCEPYVADVSEGKSGAIYSAHTYHTKVPYKAIIPFIKHYTEPGDIVFDGFCGSGMTGVAVQMSGRCAILCDLSTAATFIAYNYNTPVDVAAFEREAKRILQEVEAECVWMYETWHPHCDHPDRVQGRINYTVWSDMFRCPYCSADVIFWTEAVDKATGSASQEFKCPKCNAAVSKKNLDRVLLPNGMTKQIPVMINYSVGRDRYEKRTDQFDLEVHERIGARQIPYWYPHDRMMHMPEGVEVWGDNWRPGRNFQTIADLYTKRGLWAMSLLWNAASSVRDHRVSAWLKFWIHSVGLSMSRLNRYRRNAYSQVNQQLSGTLYLGSLSAEVSPWYALTGKMKRLRQASVGRSGQAIISTCSATDQQHIRDDSIDYVFTDPPFGDNLTYGELNFPWESWLRVFTNTGPEAIISEIQQKDLEEYRDLMTACFGEMYRILKPGRWITVVFHNSKASVWNAIQDALARAGFLVAQVTIMDKQQGTFKQVTSPGAVKNDLIINAYKPHKSFEERFLQRAGYGLEQEFVAQHLGMLPVEPNLERSPQMLYSKMLAYYVQHGYEITLNADQFYRMLEDHFLERDGYWFLDEEQVQEYERRRITKYAKGAKGTKGAPLAQQVLFISDERSAIAWLYHFLERPKDYSEIYTAFVKALQVPEDQIPEIKTLLEENFVQVNGDYKRAEMLEKRELEARRQQRLLREFEDILEQARRGQRLKDVRKEAVLAGFAQCYREKRFEDILLVGRKLHKRVVESSMETYDFIDIAEAKVG